MLNLPIFAMIFAALLVFVLGAEAFCDWFWKVWR